MPSLKELLNNFDNEIEKVLFIDIETVANVENFDELPEAFKEEFVKRHSYKIENPEDEEELKSVYVSNAAISPEFSKVVVISVGIFKDNEFRMKSYYGKNEKELMEKFYYDWEEHPKHPLKNKVRYICGHNIQDFDIPFLAKRFIINRLPLPSFILEVFLNDSPYNRMYSILDTMHIWKINRYSKSRSSLNLLSMILGFEPAKAKMTGSNVHSFYWEKDDLEAIKDYCEDDVKNTARIFLAIVGKRDWIEKI